MKKYLAVLSASALMSVAPLTLAASSVDLTVKGLITPVACTPSLSNGGIVDYAKISAKDLNPHIVTFIGKQTLSMSVNCDAAIQFALDAIDNRDGTSAFTSMYGLGGTQKLGGYSLYARRPIADGVAVQPIGSYDGSTWFAEWNLDPQLYLSVGAMDDDSQPLYVKNLTLDLEVSTVIARADRLDLTDEVAIDGSATLQIKYL